MGNRHVSVMVGAPPETVFGLYTDPGRAGDWLAGVREVRIAGPPDQPGSRGVIVYRWPFKMTAEVLQVEPPARHVQRLKELLGLVTCTTTARPGTRPASMPGSVSSGLGIGARSGRSSVLVVAPARPCREGATGSPLRLRRRRREGGRPQAASWHLVKELLTTAATRAACAQSAPTPNCSALTRCMRSWPPSSWSRPTDHRRGHPRSSRVAPSWRSAAQLGSPCLRRLRIGMSQPSRRESPPRAPPEHWTAVLAPQLG
jgi:Polyketide cyclase / dehydrase and lipid transport